MQRGPVGGEWGGDLGHPLKFCMEVASNQKIDIEIQLLVGLWKILISEFSRSWLHHPLVLARHWLRLYYQ